MASSPGLRPIRALALPLLGALSALFALGCPGVVEAPGKKPPPELDVPALFALGSIDQIDLLLMIDNSRSMGDKQAILAAAVPDLVQGLVNPACLDGSDVPTKAQPSGPLDPCPAGTRRRFSPVTDIHIGIITSSLGGHGSDACPGAETITCSGGASNASNNDLGHLVSRKDPCTGGSISTYQSKGFVAWDPKQKLSPPGESSVGDLAGTPGLVPTLRDLVVGVGQIGCGYESQLESWYRFLADPEPYEKIVLDDKARATPVGTDEILLQQRLDFLRPSSLLAILMLTDENDCSTREYGQYYFMAQQRDPNNPGKNFYLPKARSECAVDPNDPCCKSCGQDPGSCGEDPSCGILDSGSDDVNLRCWDQKRRFGIDFLYPIDRYTTALTSPLVPDRQGNLVDNPIFSDLDPSDGKSSTRDPSMVLLLGIVGVPWQDIARDPTDLTKGLKNASELAQVDKDGHTTWDYILGDPAKYVLPLDPHMIDTTEIRTGINPITGTPLQPPGSPSGADPINGHEYSVGTKNGIPVVKDDLQYACIFDLPAPKDCSPTANNTSCDCSDPLNDNPLCEPDPNHNGDRTLQVRAKGYPGIRHLSVVESLGNQGLVASVCPAQVNDVTRADFGYRPAIGAFLERFDTAFVGKCLPRTLQVDESNQVPCVLIEARAAESGCSCDPAFGRKKVAADHAGMLAGIQANPAVEAGGLTCSCEIEQLSGAALESCQNALEPSIGANGWCYVDATTSPPVGNPDVVAVCPENEARMIRLVGEAGPVPGALVFIACPK